MSLFPPGGNGGPPGGGGKGLSPSMKSSPGPPLMTSLPKLPKSVSLSGPARHLVIERTTEHGVVAGPAGDGVETAKNR